MHPLVIGAVDRASSLSEMLSKSSWPITSGDPRKINRIAQNLNSRYPSHSYPILQEEAARIGLNVKAWTRR